MNLIIKNKLFSLRGHSEVKDEAGNPQFFVRGKFFSVTNKKKIEDADGNVLFTVRNKIFNLFWPACFVLDKNGNKICKVKRRVRIFSNRFDVIGYSHNITIEGDIIARNFSIIADGEEIGRIKQNFLVLTDTFVLQCYNDANAPFLVALIIAIDNIIDRMQNQNNH